MSESTMTIGQVAKQASLTTEAIRFYEREGLLPKPSRTHTGYRLYANPVLGKLRFIRQARTLGLSLQEIKEIFKMARIGRTPCSRVRELLADKLTDLDQKIAELRQFRRELDRFIQTVADLPDQADASESVCALIEIAPTIKASAGAPSMKRSRKLRDR